MAASLLTRLSVLAVHIFMNLLLLFFFTDLCAFVFRPAQVTKPHENLETEQTIRKAGISIFCQSCCLSILKDLPIVYESKCSTYVGLVLVLNPASTIPDYTLLCCIEEQVRFKHFCHILSHPFGQDVAFIISACTTVDMHPACCGHIWHRE